MQSCNPDYTGLITALVGFLGAATAVLNMVLVNNRKQIQASLKQLKDGICDGTYRPGNRRKTDKIVDNSE